MIILLFRRNTQSVLAHVEWVNPFSSSLVRVKGQKQTFGAHTCQMGHACNYTDKGEGRGGEGVRGVKMYDFLKDENIFLVQGLQGTHMLNLKHNNCQTPVSILSTSVRRHSSHWESRDLTGSRDLSGPLFSTKSNNTEGNNFKLWDKGSSMRTL